MTVFSIGAAVGAVVKAGMVSLVVVVVEVVFVVTAVVVTLAVECQGQNVVEVRMVDPKPSPTEKNCKKTTINERGPLKVAYAI